MNFKLPELSKRLQAVADMVPEGAAIADIGTDHGYVPIYLAASGRVKSAIAMDVRTGPLERAMEHVSAYGMDDIVMTRLSDGLLNLDPGEADTMICAGMGGLLMQRIITDGDPRSRKIRTMILEPQSDLEAFRFFLRENGFIIEDEEFLKDEGKYYPVMKVRTQAQLHVSDCPGDNLPDTYRAFISEAGKNDEITSDIASLVRICDRFGPVILMKHNADLKSFLLHEKNVCDSILSRLRESNNTRSDRYADLVQKAADLDNAMKFCKIKKIQVFDNSSTGIDDRR